MTSTISTSPNLVALRRLTLLLLVALASPVLATEWTYSTVLSDRGEPAEGEFDIALRLFDAETGGRIVDSWIESDVQVVGGLLEVALPGDLDERAVRDGDLWLEIAVANTDSPQFETLPERQAMTRGGSVCTVNDLAVTGRLGIGITNAAAPIHIVDDTVPPGTLGQADNGLLLGSEADGIAATRWIQSYGAPLILNPVGNRVGVGNIQVPATTLDVGGDIKALGYQQPGTGGEVLGLVRGAVQGTGTVITGSGFTAAQNAVGQYTITFSTPFAGTPTFTATGFSGAETGVTITAVTTGSVSYETWDAGTGNLASRPVAFIVAGPR